MKPLKMISFLMIFSLFASVGFADTPQAQTTTDSKSESQTPPVDPDTQSYPMSPVDPTQATSTQVGPPISTPTNTPAPAQAPVYAPPVTPPAKLGSDSPHFGGWDPVMQPVEFASSAVHSFFEGVGCMVSGKKPPRGWERKMPQ
jgi:hypothetical protein